MGLRLKLGLYVVLFVGGVLTLVSVLWIRAERDILMDEMRARGITLLRAFAIPCTVAMAKNNTPSLDNYVVQFAEAAATMDLRYMAVLDWEGKVAAHTRSREFGRVWDDPFTLKAMKSDRPQHQLAEVDGEPLLEIAVPVISGLRWGTLRAGFTLAKVERSLQRRQARSLGMGLIVALGAAAIAYLMLSISVLRPVLRMRDMARRFGAGELGARVVLDQRDEMGQLAGQLNGMADQIQQYTDALEKRVAERTSELAEANRKLVEANQQLERIARTDPLTGLYNRRYFMEQLDLEIRRGRRKPHEFTIVMMDMDHFKHYNDTNGHTAGDELLQRFAALLEINLRSTDVIGRYGGEEFIILLLDTGPQEGRTTAEKLRAVVEAQPMPHEDSQPGGAITVSVGVSFYPHDSTEPGELIDLADRALYRSKAQGRNRVTCYRDMQ